MNKGLYEEMKRTNLEDNREIFDLFEKENRIVLMGSILTSLEIIQDRTNNKTQDRPLVDNNNNHINFLIQNYEFKLQY